jgi:site-specific recombinase XerD
VDEVRPAHVREFLTWRGRHLRGKVGKASARTVQLDRAVLRAAFAFAVELELRESNPVVAVKPPKVTKRDPVILSPEQFEALLAACGERRHAPPVPAAPGRDGHARRL